VRHRPRTRTHEQIQILQFLSGAVLSRLQLHRVFHLIEDLRNARVG
jgi:hypothetical protein